jgi:hypothetical protein
MISQGCGRKEPSSDLMFCPSICLEGMRKSKNNLNQDSRCLGQDFNLGPPEYETEELIT